MKHDYTRYIGIHYPPPNGCFKLVEQVYREQYGLDLGGLDAGITNADERVARLNECITRYFEEVSQPQEGDVICLNGVAWHVGVVIGPGKMLHQFADHAAIVTDYTRSRWRNHIVGFYRYVG